MNRLLPYLILLIVASAITGCGGDTKYVHFESSQPENVRAKKSFKKKIKATYTNYNNANDQLVISDKLIINLISYKFKMHRNEIELDSSISIDINNDDQLIRLLEKEFGWTATLAGDTITSFFQSSDTLFNLSVKHVLKRFKGSYFLNYKLAESDWRVKKMDLKKDSLFIGEITPSDTLLQYKFITKIEELNESDSTKTIEYIAKPSKREFKKLMKPNSFEKTKFYLKNK
jgi:hypothetical protein